MLAVKSGCTVAAESPAAAVERGFARVRSVATLPASATATGVHAANLETGLDAVDLRDEAVQSTLEPRDLRRNDDRRVRLDLRHWRFHTNVRRTVQTCTEVRSDRVPVAPRIAGARGDEKRDAV